MPVFLNQERTKIGTTTGTLIAFPRELDVNDPIAGLSLQLLPSGYLRCDGSVYSENVYPALAQILGTGDTCVFKQPDTNLTDSQFQVPDLRSKFIRASSASDQGVLNDLTVTNASGQTVDRSGVGVNVSSNVGAQAVIDMTGQFRVPARSVNLTGNVGFTKPKAPDESTVQANAFLPHMHYTTTFRCRTIRRGGSDVFELNYFTNASTIGVQNWFDATDEQPACKFYAQSEVWAGGGTYISSGTFLGTGATFEYYGICKGSCGGFITSCLIPTGNSVTIDTTPEGPCRQTYTVLGVGLITVDMECASSSKNLAANYVEGATGVGNDNIPTGAATDGGAIQAFSLWEGGTAYTGTNGYYSKGLGSWAYSGYGGSAGTWNNLDDFAQGDVDLIGGSGSGARATVRFEALAGTGGNPNNTRYKVIAWLSVGTGYAIGDVLTFPDVGGKNIGSAAPDGGGGISLQVTSTTFASGESAAGYPHNTSLHDVLPVDTNVDSSTNIAYPQISNIIETTEEFGYEEDPTEHTHTITYQTGLTNYQLNIPETFISTDGMSASVNINPESDTKIDSLIAPFIMVDYLIKI